MAVLLSCLCNASSRLTDRLQLRELLPSLHTSSSASRVYDSCRQRQAALSRAAGGRRRLSWLPLLP